MPFLDPPPATDPPDSPDDPGLVGRFLEETANFVPETIEAGQKLLYQQDYALPDEESPKVAPFFNPPPAKNLAEKIAGGAATVVKSLPFLLGGEEVGVALLPEKFAAAGASTAMRSAGGFAGMGVQSGDIKEVGKQAVEGFMAGPAFEIGGKVVDSFLKREGGDLTKTVDAPDSAAAESAATPPREPATQTQTPAAVLPSEEPIATLQTDKTELDHPVTYNGIQYQFKEDLETQIGKDAAAAKDQAGANTITQDLQINPSRQLKLATVMHPDDSEMINKAATKLSLNYDGTIEDTGLLQFTDPSHGSSFAVNVGASYKDLKNAQFAKAGEMAPSEIATLQNPTSPSSFEKGQRVMMKLSESDEPELAVIKSSKDGVNKVQAIADGQEFELPDTHLKPLAASDAAKILKGGDLIRGEESANFEDLAAKEDEDVFGFGPGAAAKSEPLATDSFVDRLTDAIKEKTGDTEGDIVGDGKLREVIGRAKAGVGDMKDSVVNTIATARAAFRQFSNLLTGVSKFDDFKGLLAKRLASHEFASVESNEINNTFKEAFSGAERVAMNNYGEAAMVGADTGKSAEEILSGWAGKSKDAAKVGYENALKLSDRQKGIVEEVRSAYNELGRKLEKEGLLKKFVEDYVGAHFVDKKYAGKLGTLMADMQTGKLDKSFKYAMKRIYQAEFDLEQAGFKLKTKDIGEKLSAYNFSAKRVIADRRWVKDMSDRVAADGNNWLTPSGIGKVVKDQDAEQSTIFVKPSGVSTADYVKVDHPALRAWKWVTKTEQGDDVMYEGDLWVHKEYADDVKNILGRSKLYDIPGVDLLTQANAEAKGMKLVGAFHQVTTQVMALALGVKPWSLAKIDIKNSLHQLGIEAGLKVSNFAEQAIFSEGLASGSFLHKALDIAIPGAELGSRLRGYQEYLFNDLIPRIKMASFEKVYARNMQRYGAASEQVYFKGAIAKARFQLAESMRQVPGLGGLRKQLSNAEIAQLSANQVNYFFGELNWKLMATNPTFQHSLRLALMAPDFQTARFGTVVQALGRMGAEQRSAIAVLAASTYTIPRIANMMLNNGDPKFDQPFSVVTGGRTFSVRTIPTDLLRGITDTTQFMYHRLAPWASNAIELLTGRDYRGVKVPFAERLGDVGKSFVPIPLTPPKDISWTNQLENAMGLVVRRAPSASSSVLNLASDFKSQEAKTNPKVASEIARANQETYAESDYRKLNLALQDKNPSQIKQEIQNLVTQKGKTIRDITKYYASMPNKPFTGSRMLEGKFLQQLGPEDKLKVRAAQQEQQQMSQAFFSNLQSLLSSHSLKSGS